MSKKICIVSHSGGLDSSTLIAKAIAHGYIVQPINFNYGQKNIVEMAAQENVHEIYSKMYKERIRKPIILDLNLFMGSAISSFQDLRDSGSIAEKTDLEFYMPFRNLVFASICSMIGELLALHEGDVSELSIGIGVHKHSDVAYEKNYWDITPEFIEKLDAVLNLNDSINVNVFAPYSDLYKADIIRDAVELDVPYLNTWTCYDPVYNVIIDGKQEVVPCKKCEACLERDMQGQAAGVDDINEYSIELIEDIEVSRVSMKAAKIVDGVSSVMYSEESSDKSIKDKFMEENFMGIK